MKRWLRWAMMAGLTAGAAWPSYLHGLFIARQVGYSGNVAYDVPLLPDGLIGVATIALIEASQRKVARPWPATLGLAVGIVLTAGQNIAAGYPRPGTMVVNAFVPLLLLIALEILVWSSRLARAGAPSGVPQPVPAVVKVPAVREIRGRQNCSQATAVKIRDEVKLAVRVSQNGHAGG